MNGIFRKVYFYFVCPWSEFSLSTSAEDIHTVSVWVKRCDLSLSWMGIRDFLLLGQCFFFFEHLLELAVQMAKSRLPISAKPADPAFPSTLRMCQDGALRLSLICPMCLWHCVRTPVIGPFSLSAQQTGSCSVLAARLLMQSPLHYFWEPNDRVTAARITCSFARFQVGYKWNSSVL